MTGPAQRPLADVRILAVEQYGAGPWGSLQLADLGADVIKIEDPRTGGDIGRYVPPFNHETDSLFFQALNRNKRTISIDLETDSGRSIFEDLVRVSDAVYSNLRGDVPAKLRITYPDLKHLNAQLVCCSLSGFGMTGEAAHLPGYDYMLQALTGWMSLTGEPGGPPTKSGLSLVDFSGGFVAALALICGIHAARRDGVGLDCDVSLYDTAMSMLNYQAAWHLNEGYQPTRTRHSAHPSLVPFQAFEASDGWLIVACPKEKFWRLLTRALDRNEWAADERFRDFDSRRVNREALIDLLDAEFRQRTVESWIGLLQQGGVPVARVNSVPEALAGPLVTERGLITEVEHPQLGRLKQISSPVRVGPGRKHGSPAPAPHQHREEILRGILGYTDQQISDLAAAGAFGTQ